MTPKPLHCRRVAFGRLCAGLALAAWTAQQEGCGDTYFNFQQRSNPQGIFADQNTYPPAGSAVHTIVAPLSGSGYNFAYWTVNGVIATDIVGQARTRVDFAILQDTTAIATYLPPGADTNADGVADYLQWFYFGALTNGPTSDTDGDGFTLSDELSRGYNPVIRDEIADGGVMMRVSDTSTYHDQSALKYYEIRSDPQGIVTRCNMLVATGNNNAAICMSIRDAAKGLIKPGVEVTEGVLNMVEMAFRAYDPCFGCATHSLPGQMPMEVRVHDACGAVVRNVIR